MTNNSLAPEPRPVNRDYRDLTIEHLADSEAELLVRNALLEGRLLAAEADAAGYREALMATIDALRRQNLLARRLRRAVRRLVRAAIVGGSNRGEACGGAFA